MTELLERSETNISTNPEEIAASINQDLYRIVACIPLEFIVKEIRPPTGCPVMLYEDENVGMLALFWHGRQHDPDNQQDRFLFSLVTEAAGHDGQIGITYELEQHYPFKLVATAPFTVTDLAEYGLHTEALEHHLQTMGKLYLAAPEKVAPGELLKLRLADDVRAGAVRFPEVDLAV